MNKYQEALDFLTENCMEQNEDYDWEENTTLVYSNMNPLDLEPRKRALQKLVYKAIPSKPLYVEELDSDSNPIYSCYKCPICGVFLKDASVDDFCYECGRKVKIKFCFNCGQKIDWGKDE